MIVGKLKVQVSKTSDGKGEYLQLLSEDQLTINIVLVAQKVEIHDDRTRTKSK